MNLNTIIKYLEPFISKPPEACILLGSGLSSFSDNISNKVIIPYNEIPNFYQTSVKGHIGEFIYGEIEDIPVLCGKGRFHYYEGYSFDEVGSIIQIFNYFKPRLCIITNSSGCLDTSWDIGSLMLSNQIIDFSFRDKPIIKKYPFKNSKYYKLAIDVATKSNVNLKIGSYVYTTGPSYETPAEILEIISSGGKAVGMSTFPEYLKCEELNQNFIIVSCLTNYGAGLVKEEITHQDVLVNAKKSNKLFSNYIINIIQSIEPQKI